VDHETAVRLDLPVDPLVEEEPVRAEIDVALPRDDAVHELLKLGIERRLAAADGDDRRLRGVDGLQALLDRKAILKLARVALDGAPDAREVAGVERLEHQHEGVALVALQRVHHLVLHGAGRDVKRKPHAAFSTPCRPWSESAQSGKYVAYR